MKKIFGLTGLILFAAATLFTSCKNEKEQIFSLEIEQFTGLDKTTISGSNTVWTNGDPIWINNAQATVRSNRTVSVTDPITSINRKFYSIYGGRATVNSFDRDNLAYSYTMPNSYTYNANELKAPMLGTYNYDDGDNIIRYTNICTMLKLEFVVIPSEVTITSTSTALSGDFTATYNGTSWDVEAPTATTDNKTITISNPNYASVMYVPLPAGTHKLTITGKTFTRAMTSAQNMVKSTLYPIKCAHTFSISSSAKVYMSPGNFQYYNTSTYSGSNLYGNMASSNDQARFADPQWNRIYRDNLEMRNGVIVSTGHCRSNAWIDLFGWGTGNIPGYCYATSLGTSTIIAYDDFDDWGAYYSTILNNTSHTTGSWRTLNRTHWSYLLNITENNKRSGRTIRVSVADIPGLLIAPDDFPSASLPNANSSITANNFNENYQKKGVVFLPNGGYMHHRETIVNSWGFSGDGTASDAVLGGYWTSDENQPGGLSTTNRAYFVKISPSNISITDENLQDNGLWNRNKPCKLSVRLVQDAN